ncbi:MAG TPA: mechanosensitive ion channel domain-containing protein [Actinocrinis sp.]|nr:mechanosensitive ion channel domain-containing protein [Actinocrinis sp.]
MSFHNKARRDGPHTANVVLNELRSLDFHLLPDFRKTMWYGLIALAALVTGDELGGIHAVRASHRFASYGCAAAVVVFGVAASRAAAGEIQRVAVHRAGDKAGTPLRIMVLLAGYAIAVIAFCDLMDVDVGHLLIGGAITGIVVGLAAQPVLGNLFAGLVLLFARPYIAGERVRVLSGAINGPHEGVVVSAGLLYTVLQTEIGPLNIPNSTLLASAVGPSAKSEQTGSEKTDTVPAQSHSEDPGQPAHDLATAVAEGEALADASGHSGQKQSPPGESGR